MRFDVLIKSVIGFSGSAISYLFGSWGTILDVLWLLVIVDYTTGFIAAGIEGKLKSKVGLIGIAKKLFIFLMVAVAHKLDSVLGNADFLRDAVIFFYVVNELLSIIENGGRMGVPIPPALEQAVEVLKEKNGSRAQRVRDTSSRHRKYEKKRG